MFLKSIEDKLIGPRSVFPMEQRVYHVLCIIIILMLCSFFLLNVYLSLFVSWLTILLTCAAQCFLYYLSRVKAYFSIAVIVNALVSYAAIISTFYISSGIDGPNISLFFMTFALLIAITKPKLHNTWFALHIIVVFVLVSHQYFRPGDILNPYETRLDRYIDIQISYLIVLTLIYLVMFYLKRHYNEEKKLAETMAHTIEKQKAVLENSEAKLRAFFNSSISCHLLLGIRGELLDFNNATRKYMKEKYEVEIAAGMNITSIFTTTYKSKFIANYKKALAGAAISEEYLLYDNTYEGWWAFSFEPAYTRTGQIMGVSVTGTNIHDRKIQEQKVIAQNQALSRIAFIQSHEIRRPVASIIGLMDIIKNEGYQPSRDYLLLLEEATKELDEKIHQIMGEANDLL